jgi:hypothetical protein
MHFRDQWRAVSNRIRGLGEALHLHAAVLRVHSGDSFGVANKLIDHSFKISHELRNFRDDFGSALPQEALSAINDVLSQLPGSTGQLVGDTPDMRRERAWAAVVLLSAFESEMTLALSNTQESIRTRTERAINHLQRSIIVDKRIRDDWKGALARGEVDCEKIGAVHLLLHGIYAFKVSAAGARTDLVYQEPAQRFDGEAAYADGLVLTEWKIVTSDDVKQKCEQARSQAANYACGALGGTELTSYRYIVAVSSNYVELPDTQIVGGVAYVHRNIAVLPKVPSRVKFTAPT